MNGSHNAQIECNFCGKSYPSLAAFFTHLRAGQCSADPDCETVDPST
jgi:hypothetical protein